MYISSLAHVLSISGYHMAVVAGVVFFVIRALLALIRDWRAGTRSRNGLRFSHSRRRLSISCSPAPKSRRREAIT
jgi:predicted membrane metal-binding protein